MGNASIIERAGRILADAAGSPARVILFGSGARGEADATSDLDFLVIERSVDDRIAEAVRLRRALGDIGVPVDIIVLDEATRRPACEGARSIDFPKTHDSISCSLAPMGTASASWTRSRTPSG